MFLFSEIKILNIEERISSIQNHNQQKRWLPICITVSSTMKADTLSRL